MARLTNFGSIIEKMTDRSKMVPNVQTVFNCTGMKKIDIRIDKMRIVIDVIDVSNDCDQNLQFWSQ